MNALLRKTAAVLFLCFSDGHSETPFIGRWQLVPEKSAEIGLALVISAFFVARR